MRILTALLLALPLAAQHDMSNMPDMPGMDHSKLQKNSTEPMMDMIQLKAGGWNLGFHGVAFLTSIQETGPRGHDKVAAINWFMGEASHPLAGGTFSVLTMLSLDPATVTGRYYPELFQTGETAFGKPIVDGQHPHNFVMNLGLHYSHRLAGGATWEISASPVGDPALGPVAFAHRASASELPQATIAHHLQDSTHIANEVITAGLKRGMFHLEASGFSGTESGENRWTIGYGAINSFSGRLTVTPNSAWSGQVSAGRLTKPEALEPGNQSRLSASLTHTRSLPQGTWATSLIWGRVHKTANKANLNSFGVESVARFAGKNYLSGRVEFVDKDELPLPGTFRIGAYTAGYTRDFPFLPHVTSGLGANVTVYSMPAALHPLYGERPVSMLVFLRFRLHGAA